MPSIQLVARWSFAAIATVRGCVASAAEGDLDIAFLVGPSAYIKESPRRAGYSLHQQIGVMLSDRLETRLSLGTAGEGSKIPRGQTEAGLALHHHFSRRVWGHAGISVGVQTALLDSHPSVDPILSPEVGVRYSLSGPWYLLLRGRYQCLFLSRNDQVGLLVGIGLRVTPPWAR